METCTTYADAKLKKIKKQSAHLAEVVLTSAAANSVFEEFHCSHLVDIGVIKRNSAIICRYYWPGMLEDHKWVSWYPQTLVLTHVLFTHAIVLSWCTGSVTLGFY